MKRTSILWLLISVGTLGLPPVLSSRLGEPEDNIDAVRLLLGGTIPQENHPMERRKVQTKTEFQGNYVARFKILLDHSCSASKPMLHIKCQQEASTLEVLQLSHSSLVVTDQNATEAVVGSTCEDRADCEQVFMTNDVDEDVYGEVYFQCTGDYVEAVAAEIKTLPSSGNVVCSAALNTRAFYIIEMGVFCPPPEDSVADGFYSYASQYFECTQGVTLDEKYSGNHYACVTGRNCGGLACTDQILPVAMKAELTESFKEWCLSEATVPGTAVGAPPEPAPFTPPSGTYTIRHQARWAFQYDSFWCVGFLPRTELKCLNGGILKLLEKENDGTTCSMVDESTMTCVETCVSCNYWKYEQTSGVSYECSGSTFNAARSQAKYFNNTANCTSSASYSTRPIVAHRIRLGVYCGSAVLGGDFRFSDYYAECASGNWHNVENGPGGFFECLLYKEVALTGGRVEEVLDDVIVYSSPLSENVYELMRTNDCFEVDLAPTAPTTPSPTSSPVEPPTKVPMDPLADTPKPTSIPTKGTPTFPPDDVCMETCGCTAAP